MLAKYEFRKYYGNGKVYFARYLSPANLPHWHYDGEIIYAEKGNALVWADGNRFSLQPGDSIYLAPQQIHWISAEHDSILNLIFFDGALLPPKARNVRLLTPYLPQNQEVAELCAYLAKETRKKQDFHHALMEAKTCETVLLLLRRFPYENRPENKQKEVRYLALLEKIEAEYDSIRFTDAVTFMHLTPAYFSSYFKTHAGISFSAYLNAIRVEKALPLIREGTLSMTEIADRVGFDTIRTFNRVFLSVTGYSPSTIPEGYSISSWQASSDVTAFDPTSANTTLLP